MFFSLTNGVAVDADSVFKNSQLSVA